MQKNNIGFDSRKVKKTNFKRQKEYRNKERKLLPIVLIIFLFLMLILGVGSYILIKYLTNKAERNVGERLGMINDSEWQSEWQKITEETKDDIKNKRLKEERGGESDVLSDGEIAIVLNFVERKEEIRKEKAREGYEFIILNLNIRNQKYEDILFYNSNFILRDLRYTEYNTKSIESDEINLLKGIQNIPAREGIEGSIIYEVQKEVGVLEFLYIGERKLIFELN